MAKDMFEAYTKEQGENKMFVIIDYFSEPMIATDFEGHTELFETESEAKLWADANLQRDCWKIVDIEDKG